MIGFNEFQNNIDEAKKKSTINKFLAILLISGRGSIAVDDEVVPTVAHKKNGIRPVAISIETASENTSGESA